MRFVVMGGFLGAGKSTALMRLGRSYIGAGRRVGIITNDQSDDLVDTEAFRSRGFPAQEVLRGCFCCRFDELVAAAGRLRVGHRPDVILAEPVGSCTDIVATVINPLRRLFADQLSIAPYVVLLDPDRADAALTATGRAGFSAKVTYLYKMQQHEADVVAINKVDTLTAERRAELRTLVERNFPKAQVIELSARTGEGFDQLIEILDSSAPVGANVADVDYDLYAEAEAQLGWLNATVRLSSTDAWSADELTLDLAKAIQDACRKVGVEPAHVKMILKSGDAAAIANVVSSQSPPVLSRACGRIITQGTLILNARVEADPDLLRRTVEAGLRRIEAVHGVTASVITLDVLSPAAPAPTHRMLNASDTVAPLTGGPNSA